MYTIRCLQAKLAQQPNDNPLALHWCKCQVAPQLPVNVKHMSMKHVCVRWGLHQLQAGAQCHMPAHNSRFEACVASLQWPALIGYRACMICAYALVARGDANPLCRICMASREAAGHRNDVSTSAIRDADHSAHATLVSTMARPRCAVKQESTTWSLPCWHSCVPSPLGQATHCPPTLCSLLLPLQRSTLQVAEQNVRMV